MFIFEETQIPLKILVDKAKKEVLFAEADYRFVVILFSFMMLPMGSIVRLIKKNSDSTSIGFLSSLYESLANLPSNYFLTEEFKQMLLYPVNPSVAQCRSLKLNVDDTKRPTFFICEKWECSRGNNGFYSTSNTAKCSCGRLLTKKIGLSRVSDDHPKEGVFVTVTVSFMITDDLCVKPMSLCSFIQILNDRGISDMSLLEERTVKVGRQEVLKLLELTLVSRSALTDLFLGKKPSVQNPVKSALVSRSAITDLFLGKKPSVQNPVKSALGKLTRPLNTEEVSTMPKKIDVKVLVQKSNQKPLCLLAEENFADFLACLLANPLGKVVGLLNGNTSAGSVDKFYRSISELDVGRSLISQDLKDMLLHQNFAWNYVSKNHIFTLKATSPTYFCSSYKITKVGQRYSYTDFTGYLDSSQTRHGKWDALTFKYPDFYDNLDSSQTRHGKWDEKCVALTFKYPEFYDKTVWRPAMFMLTDDLVIAPVSSISTMSLLDKLKVPVSDVEEREVSFGIDEWLRILKASLTSSSLFSGINLPMKKAKQEP